MDVQFRIRRSDLRRALRELQANRGARDKADIVSVLVSEYAATFRAPGTDSEYPVNGIAPGVAHLPITVLDRIMGMRSANELDLRLTDGAIWCGKATVRHKAIRVGNIPDLRVQVPINPSPFELVVIGRVLGEALIREQGIEQRLTKATEQMNLAVSSAASSLASFGVTEASVKQLVEAAIEDAQASIRSGLVA
jgi:hypothetical protein